MRNEREFIFVGGAGYYDQNNASCDLETSGSSGLVEPSFP
jgi:hypothetical protein